MAQNDPAPTTGRVREVAGAFAKLGLTSFGGPVAHLGYFHREFVLRRRWLDDAAYADLVALCQFLPGPASSQVAFGLGLRRGGLGGALAASVCFTLPSAVLMIALAYGAGWWGDPARAGWVHGLKLAAVAVVAQAVWLMGRKLCPDPPRIALALAAAAAVLLWPGPGVAWVQVGVIVAGGLVGWRLLRGGEPQPTDPQRSGVRGHAVAAGALAVFGLILIAAVAWPPGAGPLWGQVFAAFYRAGSLVFGGGHVVLPLLREEVVPRGWMSDDAFLAGYGAAQAVPGPLFTFAGFLGATIFTGPRAWLGGLWALLAIFLPAWLLVGGALPFWNSLRTRPWAQGALRGANAAVVGLLLAALFTPVGTEAIRSWTDAALALAGLALLQLARTPPVLVVAGLALAAQARHSLAPH